MKMNIDIIQEAIEIPYISENYAAFANHILGRLQQQIKETIAKGEEGISIVQISKIINAAKEYSDEYNDLRTISKEYSKRNLK